MPRCYTCRMSFLRCISFLVGLAFLSACTALSPNLAPTATPETVADASGQGAENGFPSADATPLPTRERWTFNTPLPYTLQSGDTLNALAAHFNTTADAILQANPFLADWKTTLPPGLPIHIPAAFTSLYGTPFKMIPDSEFVYGPTAVGFNIQQAVSTHDGWLAKMRESYKGHLRPSWEVLEIVSQTYSVHPRLLLALLEYRSAVLTSDGNGDLAQIYPMGYEEEYREGLAKQAVWVAETLSTGYYGWRAGSLLEIELESGRVERIDPWQNAGTVALQYLFAQWYADDAFQVAISPQGFAATYRALFGDPFRYEATLIPGNLQQPLLQLPFEPGRRWVYTGGPHFAWGGMRPLASIDFAPPSSGRGCLPNNETVTAMADGVVARTDIGYMLLDLDGDGDERTGWVLLHLHLKTGTIPADDTLLRRGDFIGNPSCDGGVSTGTHIHLARRYNGEWLPADGISPGILPFTIAGWYPVAGDRPYEGFLVHDNPAYQLITYPGVTGKNYISIEEAAP